MHFAVSFISGGLINGFVLPQLLAARDSRHYRTVGCRNLHGSGFRDQLDEKWSRSRHR